MALLTSTSIGQTMRMGLVILLESFGQAKQGSSSLRVEIRDFNGNSFYTQYPIFSIGDDSTKYRLNVSGYSGTAGDSLKKNNGSPFNTRDNNNDNKNCTVAWKGAWWYFHVHFQCFAAHLNGPYIHQPSPYPTWNGIIWNSWKDGLTLKRAEMKLRRNTKGLFTLPYYLMRINAHHQVQLEQCALIVFTLYSCISILQQQNSIEKYTLMCFTLHQTTSPAAMRGDAYRCASVHNDANVNAIKVLRCALILLV